MTTQLDLYYITAPLYPVVTQAVQIIGGAIVAGGGGLFAGWVLWRILSWYWEQRMKRNARPAGGVE